MRVGRGLRAVKFRDGFWEDYGYFDYFCIYIP